MPHPRVSTVRLVVPNFAICTKQIIINGYSFILKFIVYIIGNINTCTPLLSTDRHFGIRA